VAPRSATRQRYHEIYVRTVIPFLCVLKIMPTVLCKSQRDRLESGVCVQAGVIGSHVCCGWVEACWIPCLLEPVRAAGFQPASIRAIE
jgi:hypothetical protein